MRSKKRMPPEELRKLVNGGAQPAHDVPHPRRGKPKLFARAPKALPLAARRKLLAKAMQRRTKP